ncbi:hypothetical protein M407DRAFT_153725 [Tulasnella calospora MUT 4182]|uniref:BTB domain-containing protein n=1 Tax=Tulasnella calospora MUT 4182 TaxID=1051891 RepID=A0A0C3QPV8_9AGAM|nr:hypothetical protein M407DRAFT_153725 [Tulasnella calospora MUT 4182]
MEAEPARQQQAQPSQSNDTPEDIQHHPELYFTDGNLVILAQKSNIRFKIYRGLVNRSDYFKAMLAPEPAATNDPETGAQAGGWLESDKGTDENPLILSSITFDELELVIRWITGMLSRPVSTENWVTLLATATYMMFDDLKREAVHELTPRLSTELQPSEVVSMAYGYHVPSWLAPSLTAFLSLPPSGLTAEDIRNVGEKVTLEYIQLHHNMSCFRSALALWPPPLNHDASCLAVARCKGEFARWWIQTISTTIHTALVRGNIEPQTNQSPDWVKSIQDQLDRVSFAAMADDDVLRMNDRIEGMTRNCQVNGLQACLNLPVFNQEGRAIMEAVTRLLADAAESDGLQV